MYLPSSLNLSSVCSATFGRDRWMNREREGESDGQWRFTYSHTHTSHYTCFAQITIPLLTRTCPLPIIAILCFQDCTNAAHVHARMAPLHTFKLKLAHTFSDCRRGTRRGLALTQCVIIPISISTSYVKSMKYKLIQNIQYT